MARAITAFVILIAVLLAVIIGILVKHPGPPTPNVLAPTQPATCSTTLAGPGDFTESWQKVNPPASSGGESTYNGVIAFSNVDRNVVTNVLPPYWELATPKSSQPCHPILILFGRQTHLGVFPAFLALFAGGSPPPDYTEVMVLIPFVHRQNRMNMHTFVVRMFLENAKAVEIGNKFYGYAKQQATFYDMPPELGAIPLGQTTISMITTVASTGAWVPYGPAALPNLDTVTEILEMPLIGIKLDDDGKSVEQCSYFELNYGGSNVRSVTVDQQYLQSVANGTAAWPSLGKIHSVIDGAVEVSGVDWKIQWPQMSWCSY